MTILTDLSSDLRKLLQNVEKGIEFITTDEAPSGRCQFDTIHIHFKTPQPFCLYNPKNIDWDALLTAALQENLYENSPRLASRLFQESYQGFGLQCLFEQPNHLQYLAGFTLSLGQYDCHHGKASHLPSEDKVRKLIFIEVLNLLKAEGFLSEADEAVFKDEFEKNFCLTPEQRAARHRSIYVIDESPEPTNVAKLARRSVTKEVFNQTQIGCGDQARLAKVIVTTTELRS